MKIEKSNRGLIVIILLLIGLTIAKKLTRRHFDNKLTPLRVQQVELQFDRLESHLKRYKTNHQTYPSSERGLRALITQPSPPPEGLPWKQIAGDEDHLVDPWENPYQYRSFIKDGSDGYQMWSTGRDGLEGTEDDIHRN